MATVTRPLDQERQQAAAETSRRITDYLQAYAGDVDRFILRAGHRRRVSLEVPTAALELLREILEEMGRGNSVRVVPYHAELTTQEAADLLNVSRPFVIKLIEQGKIAARKVGTHRRLRLEDVMAYKRADDEARKEAADALAREAQAMGLGCD